MCVLREQGIHSYNIEGRYLKTGIGRMVWIFGTGYGDIMVVLVVMLYMLFPEVAKVVWDWHQIRTEALAGGTMDCISLASES